MKKTLIIPFNLFAISLQVQACITSQSGKFEIGEDTRDEDSSLAPATDFRDDSFFPSQTNDAVSTSNIFLIEEFEQICASQSEGRYVAQPPTRSMAGPILVREAVSAGVLPTTPIRDEEFLNYYNRGYPFPGIAPPYVSLSADSASDEAEPVAHNLQLAVFTAKASKETRRRLNLVLAVDTSASMSGRGIEIARATCRAAADLLRNGDSASIVTWDIEATMEYLAPSISESDFGDFLSVCDGLTAHTGTATDLRSGLTTAYEIASRSAEANTLNHILFLSDGGATAGVTDKDTIKSFAERTDAPPIYLSAVGTAESFSRYNESLMKMFADAGNGDHYYLPSHQSALSAIRDRFGARLETVGTAADIRLTLPTGQTVPEDLLNFDGSASLPKGRRLESGSSWIIRTEAIPCDASSTAVLENASFYLSFTPEKVTDAAYLSATQSSGSIGSSDTAGNFLYKTGVIRIYTTALRAAAILENAQALSEIEFAVSALDEAASATGDEDIEEMLGILQEIRTILSQKKF